MNKKLMTVALGVATAGLSLAACDPHGSSGLSPGFAAATASSSARPGTAPGLPKGTDANPGGANSIAGFKNGSFGTMMSPGVYRLHSMPAGTVVISQNPQGQLQARVDMFGLTPGSSHNAAINDPAGNAFVHVATFPVFTADATGQAHVTLTENGTVQSIPSGSRFLVSLGTYGGDFNRSLLNEETIARSDVLPRNLKGSRTLQLRGQSSDINGARLGQPTGRATIVYDAKAMTLTVILDAAGLTPGAHAAHIHSGSCMTQGPVKYMMQDFVADSTGSIVHQTRVISGVASVPTSGWYLNLHQGDMNDIVVNNAPAPSFRPLLCADLSVFAMGSAPAPGDTLSNDMANNALPDAMMPQGGPPAGAPADLPIPAMTPTASPIMASPSQAPISHW